MRKFIVRLTTNTSRMPTKGVIALGAAAIIAQIVLSLISGTPLWGVILTLVLINGVCIPLVIWLERAATAATVNVYLKRRAPSPDTLQSDGAEYGAYNAP